MRIFQIMVLLSLLTSTAFAGGWTREMAWSTTLHDELRVKGAILVHSEDANNGRQRIHTVTKKQMEADLKWDGKGEPPLPFGKALKIVQSHLLAENPGYDDLRVASVNLGRYGNLIPGPNWYYLFNMWTGELGDNFEVVMLMDGTVLEPEIYTKPPPPETAPPIEPPEDFMPGVSNKPPTAISVKAELSEVEKRMKAIIIPEVDFRQANLFDVIDFMDKMGGRYGSGQETRDESRIRIKGDKSLLPVELKHGVGDNTPCLTFTAKNIPLLTLVKLMTQFSSLRYVIDGNVVTIAKPARQKGPP